MTRHQSESRFPIPWSTDKIPCTTLQGLRPRLVENWGKEFQGKPEVSQVKWLFLHYPPRHTTSRRREKWSKTEHSEIVDGVQSGHGRRTSHSSKG